MPKKMLLILAVTVGARRSHSGHYSIERHLLVVLRQRARLRPEDEQGPQQPRHLQTETRPHLSKVASRPTP